MSAGVKGPWRSRAVEPNIWQTYIIIVFQRDLFQTSKQSIFPASYHHYNINVQWNDNTSVILQVAQLTYPVLLARYSTILTAYSQHIQRSTEGKDRLQLDETLCVLEVCSAMKIAPAVADAAAQSSSRQQVRTMCRLSQWVVLLVPRPCAGMIQMDSLVVSANASSGKVLLLRHSRQAALERQGLYLAHHVLERVVDIIIIIVIITFHFHYHHHHHHYYYCYYYYYYYCYYC